MLSKYLLLSEAKSGWTSGSWRVSKRNHASAKEIAYPPIDAGSADFKRLGNLSPIHAALEVSGG